VGKAGKARRAGKTRKATQNPKRECEIVDKRRSVKVGIGKYGDALQLSIKEFKQQ
jgi:predicted sulfurtransferase